MLRITLTVVAGLAAAANAGIFSFASDSSDQSWTWTGEFHGGHFALEDATDPSDTTKLLIDDGNGGLDPLVFDVDFNAHMDLHYLSSTPLGGGKFLHTYHIEEGTAGWYTPFGPVLEMTTAESIVTIVGNEFSWDSSGSLFGSSAWADVEYTSYINEPAYGMFEGVNVGPADFSFSISALNTSGVIPYDFSSLGAALDPNTMTPIDTIYAEGSFSGSAQFVPAPGVATVFAGVAILGLRRRR
ncbi:MAG: hypothetical protein IPJ41_07470 [Phycisphaerales bacterium]|nr:hypothetical protein [Phycisphaerales bacterium]